MSEETNNDSGQNLEQPKKKSKKWIWAVAVLLVIIAIASSGGNNDSEQQTATSGSSNSVATNTSGENQQKQAETNQYIKAGMHKVGTDIPAGEYLIIPSGMAYFQVSSDSTGTLDSIISNDNHTGTRYVTVEDGQYLEIRSSKMILASKAEPQKPTNNEFSNGMYKVGVDIQPGEYKIAATKGYGYVEVASDSIGDLGSIVSNDNFEGEKYITVSNGQYLKLNNCKLIYR